ncbi:MULTISPECIES: RbsD/FucU domain-containing protein [unclassified Ensifer]|uniref:RbsD/FucU family protein n=1 Tax=unclassified Ensifer TaxID=2633371 RepID=UPI000812F1DF|nr:MULTISPECIES: RbsD/FucU domain-containing protein [unclassified Ensifer]OCP00209.1 fucose-binding protein [Ensifer sp. LC11]OCP00400.1 fucose-binding protein [Ensifer sp. LC13]OCP04168.1 fucose-binding protein [Ensifer sp. LC14]OCP31410.1 fucose-binding protein [Ensifer sp. LC499]
MLKNIDPALNADVLHALRSMGHGDRIALVDANFPADTIARHTRLGLPLHIANVSAARAVRAILSVMPLDTPLQPSAARMAPSGKVGALPDVQREVQAEIARAEGDVPQMYAVERFAFYEEAKRAYCIIVTGEPRLHGCFLFTKGVVPPANHWGEAA